MFCLVFCLVMRFNPCLFSPRPLSPILNPRTITLWTACICARAVADCSQTVLFSITTHRCTMSVFILSPPAIPYPHLHLLNVTYEIRMFVTFNMCHIVSACQCVKGDLSPFWKVSFFVCLQTNRVMCRVAFVVCVGVRGRLKKYKKIIK